MLIVRGLLLSNLLVYWEMTKKKILRKLSNQLSNALHNTTSETVTAIWEQFKDLCSLIGTGNNQTKKSISLLKRQKNGLTFLFQQGEREKILKRQR